MKKLVCDGGCGTEWDEANLHLGRPAITGERSNGLSGGCLPDGEFHWCSRCATIAFTALQQADRYRGPRGAVG